MPVGSSNFQTGGVLTSFARMKKDSFHLSSHDSCSILIDSRLEAIVEEKRM